MEVLMKILFKETVKFQEEFGLENKFNQREN